MDLVADNINYVTASNIAIYPLNSDQDINELCNQMRFDKNMKIEVIKIMKHHPFPNPISIYNYLQKYCDFTGLITKKQLTELSNYFKEIWYYYLDAEPKMNIFLKKN
ncbi:unnamed protein product [Paramecium octaurelia]|nr:unnamed protein product [Paramecium octaurelia]